MSNNRSRKSYPDADTAGAAIMDPPSETSRPDEPSDETLLQGFVSNWSRYPADELIIGAQTQRPRRAGDLLAEDQRAFLVRKRQELERGRAERQRGEAQRAAEKEALARARRLEARTQLTDAFKAYQYWQSRDSELRNQLMLLEADLAKAKSEWSDSSTARIVECQITVPALKIQIDGWRSSEPLGDLRLAVDAAKVELVLLHQKRRAELVDEACQALQQILDPNHLRSRASLFGGITDLKVLAESSYAVIELDKLADFRSGSYGWNYSVGDAKGLVGLTTLLQSQYEKLLPLIDKRASV